MIRCIALALVLVSTAACSKKDKDKPATGSAAPTNSAPIDSAAAAGDPGSAAGSAVVGEPAGSAGSAAAAAVDVCTFATKADLETAGGKLTSDPKSSPPIGAVMGGCQLMFEKHMVMADARPADEFEATAGTKGKAVTGIGEKAYETKNGLLVKVAGKPYFLHVVAMAGSNQDPKVAEAVAKVLVAGAK